MRKFALIALGTTLIGLLVAACGGGSSGSGGTVDLTTGTKTTAACGSEPVAGGALVYARQAETITVDPLEIKNGNGDIFTDEMIYAGLVKLNPEGGTEIQPALAESWDKSKDGKTYTFHLRPGIKFSDGSPITAEDVVWSLNNFGNPEVNEVMAVLTTGYKTATEVDPRTVKVTLSEPVAAFLYNIAVFPAVILPKAEVEKEGDAFWKHPVGAGPFVLKEFVQGSHVTLEKNPYYYEEGKPYLDSVRFNFATDSNTRVLDLKSEQAQIIDGVPFSQIAALQGEQGIAVQTVKDVPAWILLSLNNEVPALSDQNVRLALQYSLNREEMNEAAFKGVGTIPNSLFAAMKYTDKSIPAYAYEVDKAKEYLAKSKYGNGFSLTLSYPSGFDFLKTVALIVQQDWEAIGVKVKLEEESAATAAEKWSSSEYEATIPFPTTTSDIPVPDEYAGFFANPASGTEAFFSHWENPTTTKNVVKFQITPDEAEQAKQWPVIQKEFNEGVPSLNLMDVPFVNAHADNVCGTAVNTLGVDHLEQTWIAKG
ncbi:MAG: ABC transporter substrate-binding protein [Actinobacteria bacterium]|nr:ABC transporter substrate-binding protein [Actinomycetota bacterium]